MSLLADARFPSTFLARQTIGDDVLQGQRFLWSRERGRLLPGMMADVICSNILTS
jgi:hypothetical protein